jgi:hypothetical protein
MRLSKREDRIGSYDVYVEEYALEGRGQHGYERFKTLNAHLVEEAEVSAAILASGRWALRLDSHIVVYMDDDTLRRLQRSIGSERRSKRQ